MILQRNSKILPELSIQILFSIILHISFYNQAILLKPINKYITVTMKLQQPEKILTTIEHKELPNYQCFHSIYEFYIEYEPKKIPH